MINVAMLSNWHVHADGYAKEIKKLPYVNLKAVWDEDKERGEKWAAELNCEFVEDLDALLADSSIDGVLVGTPTSMHEDVICRAAKAKKAIFTEKVLAADNKAAESIKKAVVENDVLFCIALRRRTQSEIIHAKKMVDEGAIGTITYMRVRDAHNGATAGWLPATFYDKKQCGGGAMMDLGAHSMYLTDYFLGLPKAVFSQFTQYTNCGVDDNCVTVMEYDNGAIAVSETAFVSQNCPFSLELAGDKGFIYINSLSEGLLYIDSDGSKHTITEFDEVLPQPVEMFAEALDKGKGVPFGIDQAVSLTKLMDAAYRSYESGKKENI